MLPSEAESVGALRVDAYAAKGLLELNPGYADQLRTLGLDGSATVLVAVDEDDGKLLGSVMLDPGDHGSGVIRGTDEAEARMLAVAPQAQGQGVARALMVAVIDAAAARGYGSYCFPPVRSCPPPGTSTSRLASRGHPSLTGPPSPGAACSLTDSRSPAARLFCPAR
ncbi:MAG TPA: GNAT family N-acetyltransferase [Trebonia sp.]